MDIPGNDELITIDELEIMFGMVRKTLYKKLKHFQQFKIKSQKSKHAPFQVAYKRSEIPKKLTKDARGKKPKVEISVNNDGYGNFIHPDKQAVYAICRLSRIVDKAMVNARAEK